MGREWEFSSRVTSPCGRRVKRTHSGVGVFLSRVSAAFHTGQLRTCQLTGREGGGAWVAVGKGAHVRANNLGRPL